MTQRSALPFYWITCCGSGRRSLTSRRTRRAGGSCCGALMNVRMPAPVSDEFLGVQDAYLQEEIRRKGITDLQELEPGGAGDLSLAGGTSPPCAATPSSTRPNSQMLGCFVPCHGCIDNAIHSFAGVQLRLACQQLMQRQGHEEGTGKAKITPAYNLPCRYVLHTVGPIITGRVTGRDCQLLASCYRSCLELAERSGCRSVAFCCISAGGVSFSKLAGGADCRRDGAGLQTRTDKPHGGDLQCFSGPGTTPSTDSYWDKLDRLSEAFAAADAVLIGGGAGLSTSAGFVYSGERFERYFSEFEKAYGFHDMYSGGFYPYDSLEQYWPSGAATSWSTAMWIRPVRSTGSCWSWCGTRTTLC